MIHSKKMLEPLVGAALRPVRVPVCDDLKQQLREAKAAKPACARLLRRYTDRRNFRFT